MVATCIKVRYFLVVETFGDNEIKFDHVVGGAEVVTLGGEFCVSDSVSFYFVVLSENSFVEGSLPFI